MHLKLPKSAGLLVFRKDSKLLRHIELMLNCSSTSGLNTFETHQIRLKLSIQCWSIIVSKRFKSFKTHRIYLKQPYNAGLLVFQTDLKLSKHTPPLVVRTI